MRLKKYLTEKWIHSTKVRVLKKTHILEIFYNPSKGEYKDATKAGQETVLPTIRGRNVTGFILPNGDTWIWRGDVWHWDLPDDARKAIGRGTKGFHFGMGKNEISFYTTVESGQLKPDLALKLKLRLAKIEPNAKNAKIFIDDMALDQFIKQAM